MADSSAGERTPAVRQQAGLARLGQVGLQGGELEEVLREAMVTVAETLEVRDAGLFELVAEGEVLRGRAGLFDGRLAGRATVGRIHLPVDEESLPGFAVSVVRTVVSPDIHADARFGARAGQFSFPGRGAIAAPIGWDERPIGVLVVYDRAVRRWEDDEVRFVQSVATTMGLAIQRSRVEADLRESSTRLAISLSAGGLGAWSWDVGRSHVDVSSAVLAICGLDATGFDGSSRAFLALVHPDDRDEVVARLDEVAADEAGAVEHRFLYRIVRPDDGGVRWIEAWGRNLRTEASGLQVVGVLSDVTERRLAQIEQETLLAREQAARVEAEVTRERLAFLAEAGTLLSSSLEIGVTLQSIAELSVPTLADVCFIDLVDDDGDLVEAAARAASDQHLAAARALRDRRRQLGADAPTQTGHRTALLGKAVIYQSVSDEQMRGAAADDDHLQLFRRFDSRSVILAPLLTRGRTLGVLTLIRTGSAPAFGDDDLALVEELAARAALAIDNGRLYESRARVARSLQAALLPPALPAIEGLALAARYDVAEADVAIGGDFYDVIALPDGAWGVVVGDVCGRGPDAAALTGLVRHTIRTAVVRQQRPSSVLADTNAAVLQQIDDARFCTAAYVRAQVVDAAAGRVEVVASSAGHPRPFVVRAGGAVDRLECAGTLLGVVEQPELTDVEVVLGPGDALVLYTDGVTEARQGDELFGEGRLRSTLASLAGRSADEVAGGLDAAVAAFRRSARDDTAILVVQAVRSA